MFKMTVQWILLTAVSFGMSLAHAYVGSVSAATGETGSAAVEATENPFGNPAGLAFINGYYFTAGFGSQVQSSVGSNQDLSVSLTDNMKDTIVPASLSYVQTNVLPEVGDDALQRNFKLSFGNFLQPGFSLGLGIVHQDDRLEQESYQQTNAQIGILMAPSKDLGFAAVFDNLIPPDEDVPEAYRQKQTMTLGASMNFKRLFRFKADVKSSSSNSFNKPTAGLGMESYLNRWLVIRLGGARNTEAEANLFTAGMGFVGPKFGLHYAYQNSPQEEAMTRHSVDMAIPIW